MSNTFEFLEFDALPAATVSDSGDEVTITAPPIREVEKGQEVVVFLRSAEGHGKAIYVELADHNLKHPIVVVIHKRDLPKAKVLIIDYGAYINRRAVHRSAVAYYPPLEEPAKA